MYKASGYRNRKNCHRSAISIDVWQLFPVLLILQREYRRYTSELVWIKLFLVIKIYCLITPYDF